MSLFGWVLPVINVQTAHFNTASRSLGAAALYIRMKSALREKQLEEYGC